MPLIWTADCDQSCQDDGWNEQTSYNRSRPPELGATIDMHTMVSTCTPFHKFNILNAQKIRLWHLPAGVNLADMMLSKRCCY